MTNIGATEAKMNLARLLDRVAAGEEITITRNGEPVAELVPPRQKRAKDADAAVAWLKAFGSSQGLQGVTIEDMIAIKHAGHRY